MGEKLGTRPKRSLSDELAARIQLQIQTGGYRKGDRLPPIADQAREFGVGNPTAREALKKLEAMGIVQIRHGSGVYVVRTGEVLLHASPDFTGAIDRKLLLDLMETRQPIEVQSAARAARNATDEHLEELRRLLASARASLDDDVALSSTNMSFHHAIALASGNTVMAQLLHVLHDLFAREQRQILDIYGSREKDYQEHLLILEALVRRDEALSAERMRAHLEGVREALLRWDPEVHPVR